MGKFSFTGQFKAGKDGSVIREGKTGKGIDYKSLNFGVDIGNSRAFVELFAMDNDEIETIDVDGNKITISKADCKDPEVVEKVAYYRQNRIKTDDGEYINFVNAYDFVNYINDNKSEFENKVVTITGKSKKNIYNGTIDTRFEIQNIYIGDDDAKKKLSVNEVMYFNADSIDDSEWEESKKIYINGYVNDYVKDAEANRYIPQQFVFDFSKFDKDDELHMKRMEFFLGCINIKIEDDKLVFIGNKRHYYAIDTAMYYVNGNEEIKFDKSMLTPEQQKQIDLKLNTLDDFRPKGKINGQKVQMFKICNFNLKGDYSEGVVDTELTESEFEEMVYTPVANVDKIENEVPFEEDNNDEDDEDLFA